MLCRSHVNDVRYIGTYTQWPWHVVYRPSVRSSAEMYLTGKSALYLNGETELYLNGETEPYLHGESELVLLRLSRGEYDLQRRRLVSQ